MGACVSRPQGCVGTPAAIRSKCRNCRRRRRVLKRRIEISGDPAAASPRSNKANTPSVRATVEEQGFESMVIYESDDHEDDYYSALDDVLSVNGSTRASVSDIASIRELSLKDCHGIAPCPCVCGSQQNQDAGPAGDGNGVLLDHCLPCIPSALTSFEKKGSLSPGHHASKKRLSFKLSFKSRDGHADPPLCSPKALIRRPKAGLQTPYCPADKKISDSWSPLDPSSFRVRSKTFFKDKKKDFAPNCAAFYPIGVDIFLSARKIDHVARFVELPAASSYDKLPPILVVNIQVPLYPTSLFQSENDGEGMSVVMYFRLSESYSKELPVHFQETLTRFIDDEVERVKGFPVDTIAPVRERLKILGKVANLEDLELSAAEKKVMNAYNEKPVLSRPQHEFYLGENYFEIDLDMHRFSYISRKGFEAFRQRLKFCVLDFGLTIQANRNEDLPEYVLASIRLIEINYKRYCQLGL
uniref:Protein ENHANCED DISEASE RESISTANCE 2 C-terminal domain-containing protein n=1 Tax=Kalanchoe fedtschenkoi TaxID=63787 RepID=A0A7N0T5U8_KALFE